MHICVKVGFHTEWRPLGFRTNCVIPAPHDKTLLEMEGIGEKSTTEQYCRAIHDYIEGVIDHKQLVYIMGVRRVLNAVEYYAKRG